MSEEITQAVGAPLERGVRPRVRYVLHPGYVTSATDGQEHFIGGPRLAALYGVNIRDREAVVFGDVPEFLEQPGDVHLHPRYDGHYSLPAGPNVADKRPVLRSA